MKAAVSQTDLKKIQADVERLRKLQSEQDSPQALAALPELKRSDIPRRIEIIPTEKTVLRGIPVLKHEIFANGIVYLDLAFDVSDIPEDLQIYLPIMGKLMSSMGAAGFGYEQMAKRSALTTGGIGAHLNAGMKIDAQEHWQKMVSACARSTAIFLMQSGLSAIHRRRGFFRPDASGRSHSGSKEQIAGSRRSLGPPLR